MPFECQAVGKYRPDHVRQNDKRQGGSGHLQKQKKLPDAITAYEKAYSISKLASTKKAIETCQSNIEIAQHNTKMDSEAVKQKAAEDAEAARVAEEKAKVEAWKRKQEDDD